jgi:hypothetical protein
MDGLRRASSVWGSLKRLLSSAGSLKARPSMIPPSYPCNSDAAQRSRSRSCVSSRCPQSLLHSTETGTSMQIAAEAVFVTKARSRCAVALTATDQQGEHHIPAQQQYGACLQWRHRQRRQPQPDRQPRAACSICRPSFQCRLPQPTSATQGTANWP